MSTWWMWTLIPFLCHRHHKLECSLFRRYVCNRNRLYILQAHRIYSTQLSGIVHRFQGTALPMTQTLPAYAWKLLVNNSIRLVCFLYFWVWIYGEIEQASLEDIETILT